MQPAQPTTRKPRLQRTSLAPLTLDEALKKTLEFEVPPPEPRKPGAGRKPKSKSSKSELSK